jgi:hypothetical protein
MTSRVDRSDQQAVAKDRPIMSAHEGKRSTTEMLQRPDMKASPVILHLLGRGRDRAWHNAHDVFGWNVHPVLQCGCNE